MSPRRLVLAVLACSAAATAPAAASGGPLVNAALTGSASTPEVNDGNAATSSCGSGAATVDLGRARQLEGFGVSLTGDAPTARVTIEAGGRHVSATVPVGTPAWLPRAVFARTVRLRTSQAGICIAELRALAHGRPAIVGHDLSFAVQEAAAGA